ncbi:hypothetical protein YC2023_051210 [Brassica napus]
MDPKEKRKKLSTPELESPCLSKKDVAITNPSLHSKVDVGEAMKKQNDVAMFLTEKVISVLARNFNFVFSPASINAYQTMVAVTSEEQTLRSSIFSILRSSSIDELNAVFHEGANTIFVDGTIFTIGLNMCSLGFLNQLSYVSSNPSSIEFSSEKRPSIHNCA